VPVRQAVTKDAFQSTLPFMFCFSVADVQQHFMC